MALPVAVEIFFEKYLIIEKLTRFRIYLHTYDYKRKNRLSKKHPESCIKQGGYIL